MRLKAPCFPTVGMDSQSRDVRSTRTRRPLCGYCKARNLPKAAEENPKEIDAFIYWLIRRSGRVDLTMERDCRNTHVASTTWISLGAGLTSQGVVVRQALGQQTGSGDSFQVCGVLVGSRYYVVQGLGLGL